MWYQTLDTLVEEFAGSEQTLESLSTIESKARRKLALLLQNDETYESTFVLTGPTKRSYLEAAILLHWYLPAYWAFELEEEILRRIDTDCDDETKAWCLELLTSKYVCLFNLGPQLSQNDYHGNVVRTMRQILSRMELRLVPTRRPRHQARRRGYQDHGSLRLPHEWRERHPWTDTEFGSLLDQEVQEWELIRNSLPTMKMIFRKTG